ncbi:hypothetical protein OG896_03985 [Streptomyces sp. NBC_00669]|uniref:DUF6907 domain-containing protein n=1 Tax=Streptomyces sp. NBC_00669 TaxID=2976011 RepID=UPI002E375A73|nr:hypothetical protein [Streptomyces sp. NBC_00669]
MPVTPAADNRTFAATTDQPSLASSASARTWTITTDTGFSISGHLPPWATDDPSEHQLPVDRLGIALSDINHHQDVCGHALPLRTPDGSDEPGHDTDPVPVFSGSIDCDPYATEPEPRIPVFNFRLVDDYRMEALGPEGITELAAAFRAHAEVLDTHVRHALIEARGDWARQHTNRPA